MLTKQDLSEIKNLLQPINNRLDKIDNKLIEHDKQFKTVNKKLNKLQIDITTTIEYFEIDIIHGKKRLNRIESHLGLPAPSYT